MPAGPPSWSRFSYLHPRYQVDEYGDEARIVPASRIRGGADGSKLFVVLARRGNGARMVLHNTLGVLAGAVALLALRRHGVF